MIPMAAPSGFFCCNGLDMASLTHSVRVLKRVDGGHADSRYF